MNDKVIEISRKIGQFYLEKNNGDYDKTQEEILTLQFKEINLIAATSRCPHCRAFHEKDKLIITLKYVGLLIGIRGENIGKLSKYLGMEIHVIEATQSIADYIMPYEPEYQYFPLCDDDE